MKPLPQNGNLKELQEYIKEMEQERGFASQSIHEQFMKLLEECGELAKSAKHQLKHPENKTIQEETAHETADVFIYLLSIANRLGVNIEKALQEKEKINETRTWN